MYSDRVFKDYYQDVSRYPLLTPDRERELLERYKHCPLCKIRIPNRVPPATCPMCNSFELEPMSAGNYRCAHCGTRASAQGTPQACTQCGARRDFKARDELLLGNLRYVILVAKRFSKQATHIVRLVSAGNVGLIMAVDRFDLSRETRLLAYADWWIRKEILDELNASGVVTVPVHKQKAMRRELKKNQYVCLNCGVRVEDPTKVSNHTPCTAKDHEFIMVFGEQDLFNPVVSAEKITLVSPHCMETTQLTREMKSTIRRIVYETPFKSRDRFILLRYFDLVDDERRTGPKSLHKVAAVLGITPERVRQIKENSLTVLKKELKRREITDLTSLQVS